MENSYRFCSGHTPLPPKGYEPSFFHTPGHLQLRASRVQSFYVEHIKKKCRCAEVHFQLEEATAVSHRYAPFGSFLLDEQLPAAIAEQFLLYCESELHRAGVRSIRLVHAPNRYYDAAYAVLHPLLVQQGYILSQAAISALLCVTPHGFEQGLHPWECRKLRQAQEAGIVAEVLSFSRVKEVYDFLADCRAQKNYQLSLSFSEVNRLVQLSPERVHVFAAYRQGMMAAAALCLAVNSRVLYTLYYDHHAAFHAFSPVVLLMKYIYNWCGAHGYELIDLGTSAHDKGIHHTLLTFKRHLGAVPSAKYIFQKALA